MYASIGRTFRFSQSERSCSMRNFGERRSRYVDIMASSNGVTGSCLLNVVKSPDKSTFKYIVDVGMHQGDEEKESRGILDETLNRNFLFDPNNIDFVLLTHNHQDHIGRLPLLVKKGFTGKILASKPEIKLAPLALMDSYRIQKSSAKRSHCKELYSEKDTIQAIQMMEGANYEEVYVPHPKTKVTFFKNGHLPGASIILIQISYYGEDDINILYTGDYKSTNRFFEVTELPQWVKDLPLTVVIESTYGDQHESDVHRCFAQNVTRQLKDGGDVIICVFSLGREQEVLAEIRQLQESGFIDPNIPVYVDGKLAQNYNNLFEDRETLGIDVTFKDFVPFNFNNVDKVTRTSLLHSPEQKIIITTSGFGTYGPAATYLPEFITHKNAMIHFTTGYMPEYSVRGQMYKAQEGETVKIGGVIKKKLAQVCATPEFSAHARQEELLDFLKQFRNLRLVLINHGTPETENALGQRIVEKIRADNVAILNRDYMYRINSQGLMKMMPAKFI